VTGPEVSIVIVAHSVRSELERCLRSIRDHAGMPVETILVDNASRDDTVWWTRETYPEVRVIELPRNVGDAAREHGLRRAEGRLTMFLDSDAALTPGALPSMVEALDRNPDWGVLGPRLIYEDGTLQLSCRRFPPPYLPIMRRPPLSFLFEDSAPVRLHLMADVDHDKTRPVLYVLGACQLFRTTLARRAGRFADYFFGPGDIDWCIRIRDAGGEVIYFPEATVVHHYRRRTRRRVFSRLAWHHLREFAHFQWRYRRRRRDLIRLADDFDRQAERQ
jgi:GT2 family glycosyltransferase